MEADTQALTASTRRKRSRRKSYDGSDVEFIEDDQESHEGTNAGTDKRPSIWREEFDGSSSPGIHWDNDSNSVESRAPSGADGSESGFPSSGDAGSPWEPDWESFTHIGEFSLPDNPTTEAELREHEARMRAAAAYQGLFHPTSIRGEEEQEDPWYPYDPHQNPEEFLSDLTDVEALHVEALDETRIVCYSMVRFPDFSLLNSHTIFEAPNALTQFRYTTPE